MAKPYSYQDCSDIVRSARAVLDSAHIPGLGIDNACVTEATDVLRWDATIAKVEAERDALQERVEQWEREREGLMGCRITTRHKRVREWWLPRGM